MSEIATHVWLNGEIQPSRNASPSIASISLNIGTGVFDGLMAYWNDDHYNLFRVEEHLERLRVGAARMSMDIRWRPNELLQGIRQLLEVEPPRTYYIRPIVLRLGPELFITGADSLQADVCIYAVLVGRDNASPIKCCISKYQRVSADAMPAQHKVCGVYVNSYLTRNEAEQRGFDDGLMLDRNGQVTEASAANIFFINRGQLITPAITPEILPGVTRRVIFGIAERMGVPIEERSVLAQEFADFEGAFLCATLMELKPITQIEGFAYRTEQNALFRDLLQEFRVLTHQ